MPSYCGPCLRLGRVTQISQDKIKSGKYRCATCNTSHQKHLLEKHKSKYKVDVNIGQSLEDHIKECD